MISNSVISNPVNDLNNNGLLEKDCVRHRDSIEYVQINGEYSFKLSITQEV
jgi:hypothetical protein